MVYIPSFGFQVESQRACYLFEKILLLLLTDIFPSTDICLGLVSHF